MMIQSLRRSTRVLALAGILAAVPTFALGEPKQTQPDWADPTARGSYITGQVRHQLLMLPYYSVFDNLEYRVNGDWVELFGQVVNPVLKSDAGNVVKRIEGVQAVTNNIEVLPLSSFDNRIRRAEYRAVFGHGSLYRYAMGANPTVHIIVNNGQVTLVGVVGSEMDKNLAYIQANSVPGVFSVTNHLQVQS